ncbi:hypothetical protein AX14_010517 [Amanita brunnescens Koide BX004]|nr:hypothetical protein AX14_010517 [Amanita brunnescens Koide BX004]
MAKQVSRYQHLSDILDSRGKRMQELESESKEKDEYIIKTEREHAALYREREAAERQVTSLKAQLQDATSLFESTREARRHDQEDFDERCTSFKSHIADLNAKLNLLPSDQVELRKKSAELKLALKELKTLKDQKLEPAKQVATDKTKPAKSSPKGQTDLPKKVRWSFDPEEGSSQPFWDHSNDVRFPASAEVPSARIDTVPEDEEDTPLPLASDPLHRLERETYSSRTPGAAVARSMGGDANRRLDPADTRDGGLIANIPLPPSQSVPLTSNLSPEL